MDSNTKMMMTIGRDDAKEEEKPNQILIVKQENDPWPVKKIQNNLPQDVIEDILSRLPVKPLIRFRCVSKSWLSLLTTDSVFIQKQFNRALENENNHGFIYKTGGLHFYHILTHNIFYDDDDDDDDVDDNADAVAAAADDDVIDDVRATELQGFCTHYESWSVKTRAQLDLYFTPNGKLDETAVKLDRFFNPDDEGIEFLATPDEELGTFAIQEIRIPLSFVGSCNGLICLTVLYDYYQPPLIYVWNPATRQCKTLPRPHTQRLEFTNMMGFVFHPRINDFKAVILMPFHGDFQPTEIPQENYIEVQVYSFSTNCWRRLGDFPYYLSYLNGFPNQYARAHVNGNLHWLANHPASSHSFRPEFILSFDLADETFQQLSLPPNFSPNDIKNLFLRTLRGCLSMTILMESNMDVWVMMEYGMTESWTKLFTIQRHQIDVTSIFPIELLKNGEFIFSDGTSHKTYGLLSYDPESKEFEQLDVFESHGDWDLAIPYVESLFPLMEEQKGVKEQEPKEETLKMVGRSQDENKDQSQMLAVKEENELLVRKAHNKLPPEVIKDILSWLPVKPLVRFRCVSKYWCSLLATDCNFIEKKLLKTLENDRNYGFILWDYDDNEVYSISNGTFEKAIKLNKLCRRGCIRDCSFELAGSSNGLICLTADEDIYVWNPSIRDCKKLRRPPPIRRRWISNIYQTDFVFHPSINEYKVVKVVKSLNEYENSTGIIAVHVYSLSTNRWRVVGDFPYCISYHYANCRAIVNGIAHWAASSGASLEDFRYCKFILCFNMADETLQELPIPETVNLEDIRSLYLRTYKGCLSMLIAHQNIEPQNIDVWVMTEYGAKESWTKLFTMDTIGYFQTRFPHAIEFFKNGELLVDMCGDSSKKFNLFSYNPENKELKKLEILGARSKCADAVLYVESLVPLMGAHNKVKEQEPKGQSNDEEKKVEERRHTNTAISIKELDCQ